MNKDKILWYFPNTFLDFKQIMQKYEISEKLVTDTTTRNISIPHWYTYRGMFLPKINVTNIENFTKGNGLIISEFPQLEHNIKIAKSKQKKLKNAVEVPAEITDRKTVIQTLENGITEQERIESGITENLLDSDIIDESLIDNYEKE